MGLGCQSHAPAVLPPGKTRYLLYTRLGGSQGQSGQVRKILPPPGFDPRTVQPVSVLLRHVSHCVVTTHRQPIAIRL